MSTTAPLYARMFVYNTMAGHGQAAFRDPESDKLVEFAVHLDDFCVLKETEDGVEWQRHGGYGLGRLDEPHFMEIAVPELDDASHILWAEAGEARRVLLSARSTHYVIHDEEGMTIWSGGLSNEGEIFSLDDSLPEKFVQGMYMEVLDRRLTRLNRLSIRESIDVMGRMRQARWVVPPLRGNEDYAYL